jgi:gliding motility-associated-like protein
VTATDGITTCTDSILVNVSSISNFNPFQDTTRQCGTSKLLDAGAGYTGYSWSNGASSQSITAAVKGLYKISVSNSEGCIATDSTYLSMVNANILQKDTSICKGSNLSLGLEGLTTGNPNGFKIQWSQGDTITGIIVSPTQTSTYYVTVSDGITSCHDSVKISIADVIGTIVQPAKKAICDGDNMQLKAQGGSRYQWYKNGSLLSGAVDSLYNATDSGTYTADIYNAAGCVARAKDSVVLSLTKKPKAAFNSDKTCAGVSIQFTNNTSLSNNDPVNYDWTFGDGNNSSLVNPMQVYSTAGTYSVRLIASSIACPLLKDTITKSITLVSPDPAARYPDINAVRNVPVTLNARNIGQAFSWSPSLGLNNTAIQSPVLTPVQQQRYLVAITNSAGCVVVDTQFVKLFTKIDIFVPQGFTPNSDGQNDRLFPITVGVQSIKYFRVYNRWGNLVFEGKIDDPAKGWDGIYRGVKQPMESYAWICEAVGIDGSIIKRSGNTLLIR